MAAERSLPTFADLTAAAERIGTWITRTPIAESPAFNERSDRVTFFKCENLQRGGAFKYRGALNAILPLAASGKVRAVATHSSGNHGTAVAMAAQACKLQAYIVIPRDSARPKIAAIERAGGQIVFCEPGLPAREAALAELLRHVDAEVVHPFDDARVIAGQGTAALELLSVHDNLDAVCTPIGGGGLIGGTAIAVKTIAPRCKVIAAEPAGADDSYRSFHSGTRQAVVAPQTMADGLRGSIGVMNFELLRRNVDDVVTVTEAEIVAAMRIVLQDLKLLAEPSSAVAVAAVLGGKVGASGQRIGVILSGGNVDLERCPFLRGELLT